ncbi:MAG: glycoside hydrolase family 11 protein [Bacteroidales bacterium]|jgi:hypothetical protein|nr:glycoside hydrolase family 11 protein [Bacteroidales bacterium]
MKIIEISPQCLRKCLLALFLWLSSYAIMAQTITANTQATHDGFFYSFWTENPNDGASMTLGPDGNYSTTWNNTFNFTAGKGWAVGSPDRVVCFEGTYDGGSNGFLALYGWTQDPLIEYYVCEKHGDWEPPGNTSGVEYYGTYTSDGGTYKVYTGYRENKPSIIGTASFQQYWSVREEQRSSGTITFANHIAAWEQLGGMQMGTTWDYQIMESEGYNSSGSSNITVWECETSAISVELTAPTAETTFDAPATINLTASASTTSGSISKVEFYNGTTKLGEDNTAPYSYTWNNVSAGTYSVTANAIDNSNESLSSSAVTVSVFAPQTPYGGTAHAIPGTIEFEEFDEGGNGNAYYDEDAGTNVDPAPNFRTNEDVEIEDCSDVGEGYNIGYTIAGEWLEYSVEVAQTGSYNLEFRVANETDAKTISLAFDGTTIVQNLSIPATGGWQTWETVTVEDVQLTAGTQIMRLTIGNTDYVNLNNVTFISNAPVDNCPNDPNKTDPGVCGCGVPDIDTDGDGTEDCLDNCPNDANKIEPGMCGCGIPEGTCDQSIQLTQGWNLIGCPIEGETDMQTALSSVWQYVEQIKDFDGFYSAQNIPELNSLTTIKWGYGYFIKVSQNCELTW